MALSSDSRHLVIPYNNGSVVIWDTQTGQKSISLCGHTEEVVEALYNPDESQIATSSYDGTVKIWEASTGRLLFTLVLPGSNSQ